MNLLGWILVLILIGVVFSAIGFNGASSAAYDIAKLIVGFIVFIAIMGAILYFAGMVTN